jgi:hypothetical protein
MQKPSLALALSILGILRELLVVVVLSVQNSMLVGEAQ